MPRDGTASAARRIAINCGGGDAPGLNAVLHAAVHAGEARGWQLVGIRDSYDGLLRPEAYPDGGLVELTPASVAHIVHRGGTILGTTNRGNPFRLAERQPDGTVHEVDRSAELLAAFTRHGLEALIAVGGDGSLAIAHDLARLGLRVVGVPKTIDNDLEATATTFGFDSAVSFATECLDRLHATAQAHRRVIVVEVMGRHAGWIAVHAGIAGGADAILVPEIPYHLTRVAAHLEARRRAGGRYAMVVVAEGAFPAGGAPSVRAREAGAAVRLGGIGERVAEELGTLTGRETRAVVLGHLLRGGMPTATDRLLGLSFGTAAIRALAEGRGDVMVALRPPRVEYVPLAEAVHRTRTVPLDGEAFLTARTLGIALGD
jgi:ATP-dependent phosphofructokinase / diphosphate-dependent phosphofructokinase